MSSVTLYNPGTAQWVPCSGGSWPNNAVEAGTDGGAKLYVARAHYEGALLPGKLHSGHRACYVPWGGEERSVPSYEVLVANPGELRWTNSSRGNLIVHAVEGGRAETGEKLYIGRVQHEGSTTPGKIHPSHKKCYISYAGKEIAFENYQILHA